MDTAEVIRKDTFWYAFSGYVISVTVGYFFVSLCNTKQDSRLDSLDLFDIGSRSCCHPGTSASVLLLLFKVYVNLRNMRVCSPVCSAECIV